MALGYSLHHIFHPGHLLSGFVCLRVSLEPVCWYAFQLEFFPFLIVCTTVLVHFWDFASAASLLEASRRLSSAMTDREAMEQSLLSPMVD